MDDKLTTWLDEQVYPRLSHHQVFGDLPGFRRVGSSYMALCPQHADSTPSFSMKEGVPFGHCFGCGQTLSWWKAMEMRGLSGQQVILELARLAGVPPLAAGDPEKVAKSRSEAEALETWWQQARAALWASEGADALDYLRGRGYSDGQIRVMDVAVRPNDAPPGGLKMPPEQYRLLVPARAKGGGRIIGFAGRRLDGESPKYQYSPGLPRNSHLWGIYRLRPRDVPVVVEGVLDTEAIGLREIVALGGTNLSSAQLQALSRYPKVILALDADEPGRTATEAAVRKLAATGTKVYVIPGFDGSKDPDEYVRTNGLSAFAELAKKAVAGHRWLANRLLPAAPLADDMERDMVLERVLDLAESYHRTDPVAAKEILDMAAARLAMDPAALAQAMERLSRKRLEKAADDMVRQAVREAAAATDWREAARKVAEARERAVALVQEPPKPLDVAAVEDEIVHAAEGLLFLWSTLNGLCRVDPGGMTTVYAASGFGKTNFLYNLLLFYLAKYPGAVILWSGEMAPRRVYHRLVSILSGVDYAEVGRGFRTGERKPEMIIALERLRAYADRIYILEPLKVPDVTALETTVAAISRRQPVTAVMVDYLQQLCPPGKVDGQVRYSTREQEVTAVARELHGLGQSGNIPVVAAVQINRAGGMQRKPQQDDARESGAIEQYSQLILGLWNARRAGVHALRDGVTPAVPSSGCYCQDDEQTTKQAAAMAESHGGVLVECALLKSRYHGHENLVVPLVYNGATGIVEDLPPMPGPHALPAGAVEGAGSEVVVMPRTGGGRRGRR